MKIEIKATMAFVLVTGSLLLPLATAASAVSAADRKALGIAVRDESRISLMDYHCCDPADYDSTAYVNILDTAEGGKALTSPYSHVGRTHVWLDPRLLDVMNRLAKTYGYSYGVSEIAGGLHSSGSYHYYGRAFDVYSINGIGVSSSNPYYQTFMSRASAMGADQVLGPGDPDHDTHVHVGFSDNGGNVDPPPAAHRIDVFGRGKDNHVYQMAWNGSSWNGWYDIAGSGTSDPSAVSWGPNRIDVFIRGGDYAIWHRVWNGSSWSSWSSLGGYWSGAPDASSQDVNRLDVFTLGTDHAIWHISWNGAHWSSWESLGGYLTSDPSAISWSSGRVDIFARGMDNAVWSKYWSYTSGWSSWYSLGGGIVGGPDVCSWAENRLDVFARGPDNKLWHKWYQLGYGWWSWESFAGTITSDPGVVSWGPYRMDIFAKGTDDACWHKYYDSGWYGWSSLGGGFWGGFDAASWK